VKRIKQVSEALANHFWKVLNKDAQFAQMVILSDQLKEEDFCSPLKLKTKLQKLLDSCQNPPISASPGKVRLMLDYLQATYEKAVVCLNLSALQPVFKHQEYECEVKELDATQIHAVAYPEPTPTPVYQRVEDPSRFVRFSDASRRRGRPRKYPLPGMSRDYMEMEETPARVKGEDDNSMADCGICGEPGDLICCEVCPSVYHLQCLKLDQIPKGRWMCFFCEVVKDGFTEALREKSVYSQPVTQQLKATEGWQAQALQILELLLLHPCSRDMKAAAPKPDFPPEDLVSLQAFVARGEEFSSLESVDLQIRKIWKHTQKTAKRNSTEYSQAFNMQLYHNKVVSELHDMFGISLTAETVNASKSDSDPSKVPKLAQD
jgi:hypothetical protein